MIVVVMPRLSDSMEEGTIVRWLKADGASVARGDALLEIETDKATETHESEHEGRLSIVAAEGQTLPVGATIAELHDDAPETAEEERGSAGADGEAARERDRHRQGRSDRHRADTRPAADRPPRGRVARDRADAGAADDDRHDGRLGVARGPRRRPTRHRPTPTSRSRPARLALAGHPLANGAYRDGHYERYGASTSRSSSTCAAACSRRRSSTPTANRSSQIAQEADELIRRARSGEITSPELAGGTFTLSDAGALGLRSADAVIVPPQAAALSIGAVEPRPVARGGELVVREQMDVELACDHRILFGSQAADFLARIRALLEDPQQLVG